MQICLSNTIIYADYDAASACDEGRVDPGVHVRAVGLLPLPHLPRLVQAPLLGRRGLGHQHVAVGGDMSLGGTDPPCTLYRYILDMVTLKKRNETRRKTLIDTEVGLL